MSNGIKRLTEEMYSPDDMCESVRELIYALRQHDAVKIRLAYSVYSQNSNLMVPCRKNTIMLDHIS